MPVSTISSVYK